MLNKASVIRNTPKTTLCIDHSTEIRPGALGKITPYFPEKQCPGSAN